MDKRPLKIIFAIDAFKGCLTSEEIEKEAAACIREVFPQSGLITLPIADGGEGTLPILTQLFHAEKRTCRVHDPLMRPLDASYAYAPHTQTALIEMAAASGLPLLSPEERNPLKATSYGTGELIRDALNNGARHLVIGIGGSATNDGGTGMLQALGYRFLNAEGQKLPQGGEILEQIASWDDSQAHPILKEATFRVACDVTSPFYGPQGAAFVFARQKGADDTMIAKLDAGMKQFAQCIAKNLHIDLQEHPGSGAAGGMGGGLLAFLQAELESGADLLLRLTRFDEQIKDADFIFTGEGRMDHQTLMGKIPGKILERGLKQHIPVIGLCGSCTHTAELMQAGFLQICPITPENQLLSEAMKAENALQNLRKAIQKSIIPIL